MYGRALNEDFAPLKEGTKEYKQAKRAREEMLDGFEAIRKDAQRRQDTIRSRMRGRKLPKMS